MLFSVYFKQLVDTFSDENALYFADTTLTYYELDKRTSQIASFLHHELGIVQGMRIGIILQRSEWYPLLFIACAKIGATYIPIPSGLQQNRILENADTSYILTDDEQSPTVPRSLLTKVYSVTKINPLISTRPYPEPNEDAIAYMIYSSGTTGAPKGIPIKQHGLAYWGEILNKTIISQTKIRVLGNTATGFDPHIWEYILAWATGGCLYFTDKATHESASSLQRYIDKHSITDATFTPKLFGFFMTASEKTELKRCYLTGEALSKSLLLQCQSANITVYNCYGPSELTFGFSIKQVDITHIDESGSVEIGFAPNDEITAFIDEPRLATNDHSESHQVSPLSTLTDRRGELLIASPYMTSGYYNNPTLNSVRFFNVSHQSREYYVYKTDDIVEVAKQRLYFRGRTGDIVKRDLNFINLEDIRSVINQLTTDGILLLSDVLMVTHLKKDYLFVFINREIDPQKIKNHIQTTLSTNEVPDHVIVLANFPTNANGKSDKTALRQIAEARLSAIFTHSNSVFVAPTELTEIQSHIITDLKNELAEINPNALADFENKKNAIKRRFTRSIDWRRLDASLRQFFKIEIPLHLLESMNYEQLINCILRPYLLKASATFIHTRPAEDHGYLFCLPPVTGDTNEYYWLIPSEIPAVLLQFPLLNQSIYDNDQLNQLCLDAFSALTVELLTLAYAQCIKLIQPTGNYHLLGWSFGGTLTVAMHQTFLPIDYTFLVDAPDPNYLQTLPIQTLRSWLSNLTDYVLGEFKPVDFSLPTTINCSEYINDYFNNLISKLKTTTQITQRTINLLESSRINMLSIYSYQNSHRISCKKLSIYQSELGLNQEPICLRENWMKYTQHLNHHYISASDHFSIIRSIQLKKDILESLPSLTKSKAKEVDPSNLWDAPYLHADVIKRTALLQQIRTKLTKNHLQDGPAALLACTGLGGTGKTTLANYFANYEQGYQLRLWFNAETPAKLYDDYVKLSHKLIGSSPLTPLDPIDIIKNYLNKRRNWLVVYDNVTDITTVEHFLPQTGGHILVTSNISNWPNQVIVGVYTPAEALHYFQTHYKDDKANQKAIDSLCKELGYLPLAIGHAAAYLNEHDTDTVESYYTEYLKNKLHFLSDNSAERLLQHSAVAYTWRITFNAISSNENQDAIYILKALAYLEPNNIRIEYLANLLVSKIDTPGTPITDSIHRCHAAINILSKYFMVELNADKTRISIHRLVQQIIHADNKAQGEYLYYLQAVLTSIFNTCSLMTDSLILGGVVNTTAEIPDIIGCYHNMLQQNNYESFLYHALGNCYAHINYDNAINYFKQGIHFDPDSSYYCDYGHCLLIHGDLTEAIKQLKIAIKLDDLDENYFSALERPISYQPIADEIDRNGLLVIKSSVLSTILLIYCYLHENNLKKDSAKKFINKLESLLIKDPHTFAKNEYERLKIEFYKQFNEDPSLNCAQTCRIL